MGILDFWRKSRENKIRRLSLNEKILRLKQDFITEIRDFEHFKQLQLKKIEILREIKEIWNKQWKEAEELVKKNIPELINKQLEFVNLDIEYINEENFILNYLLEIETRERAIIINCFIQNIQQGYIETYKTLADILTPALTETLRENSIVLKDNFLKLQKNLRNQINFFGMTTYWEAINQNDKFLDYLKDEELLTQIIQNTINDIIKKFNDVIKLELERRSKEQEEYYSIVKSLVGEEKKHALQLKSEYPSIRSEAINKLVKLGSERCVPLFRQMLRDPDFLVRNTAMHALAAISKDARDHRLYSQIDSQKFFDSSGKIIRHQFRKTVKTVGTGTILLGGILAGKAIVRVVDKKTFLVWKTALESKDVWKDLGFEYTPIEPILIKNGKLRAYKTTTGMYRVYTKVLGPSLTHFLLNPNNNKFYDRLKMQSDNIIKGLSSLKIKHYELRDKENFCIEMHEGEPRLYAIDFEHAISL